MRAVCCEATVLGHETVAQDIRLLTVRWPDRDHAPHAGQFFTLRSWAAEEAPFLSRPISVHCWDPETQTLGFLYQVVGQGTEKLATLRPGDSFQLTGPMGNGFDVAALVSQYSRIAVVGGGIGTAPMYQLTRELAAAGVKPDVSALPLPPHQCPLLGPGDPDPGLFVSGGGTGHREAGHAASGGQLPAHRPHGQRL